MAATLILAVGCLGASAIDAPPVVTLYSPAAGTQFDSGFPVVFSGRLEDDLDPPEQLEVSWFTTVDDALEAQTTVGDDGLFEMTTSGLSSGIYSVVIQVTDSGGNTTRDSVSITVTTPSFAPTISIVFPAEDEVGLEGVTYEFLARVEDDDDASETLSVTISTDREEVGEFCTAQPQPSGIVSCSAALNAGDHTLTFVVTDASGLSGSATRNFEVGLADTEHECLELHEQACVNCLAQVYPKGANAYLSYLIDLVYCWSLSACAGVCESTCDAWQTSQIFEPDHLCELCTTALGNNGQHEQVVEFCIGDPECAEFYSAANKCN